ncbi:MAG TPA: hypothetical protein VEB43_06670 [Anaeromyxobacter sp.]|nr:hypothetical protein [Anaeromyxobacter sp.]
MQANRLLSALPRAALLAVLAASGCDDDMVKRDVREDRGPLLLAVAANPAFDAHAWAVYFCAPGPTPGSSGTYRAMRIVDRRVRDVYESCEAKLDHVAPDGSAEWLGIWTGTSLTLRELVHGGDDVVLAPPPTAHVFSPAGDALLYHQEDRGTFLRRLDTGAEVSIPCLPPFAFSPAGDEIVCERPWQGDFLVARLRLADLQFSELHQPDALWEECCEISWTDRGLLLAALDDKESVVFDPVTGETRSLNEAGEWVEVGPVGFTPDGRGYVVNEVECLSDPESDFTVCSFYESRYVLVNLETGEKGVLASGETPKDPVTYFGETGDFAVSPDSRYILYSIDRNWHWRPTGL